MIFSQYLRIETIAGGCQCTQREFIRAARGRLKKQARIKRAYRQARHEWIRQGLELLNKSKREYIEITGGKL